MMISFLEIAGYILLGLISLVFIRAIKGPTVIDRLLCVNVIGTKSIIILVITGFVFERIDMFVDVAIGYGLLNYITSIAAARYYQHHKTLNPETQWQGDTNS